MACGLEYKTACRDPKAEEKVVDYCWGDLVESLALFTFFTISIVKPVPPTNNIKQCIQRPIT